LHIEAPGLRLGEEAVESAPCPCGRETPRFGVRRLAVRARSAAAYAR
jgi:hypothetical protein